MPLSRRALLLSLLTLIVLCGGALLWRFVLLPPIHPEFAQMLFKQRFTGEDRAMSMRFHQASKRLLIGMESGAVHIWDATQRESHRSLQAHQYRVEHLQFSHDGNSFFSNSGFEDITRLWESDSGKLLATIANARGPAAQGPEDDLYLLGSDDGFLLYSLEQRRVLTGRKSSGSTTALAASSDTGMVAVGTASGSIQLWQFSKREDLIPLHLLGEIKPYEPGTWILALGFSQDGQHLISANRKGVVTEWNVPDLSKHRDLPSTLKWAHQATFADGMPWLSLAGTLDPRGTKEPKVELINLEKGEALRFKARSNYSVAEMIEPLSMGFIAHGRRITGATLD